MARGAERGSRPLPSSLLRWWPWIALAILLLGGAALLAYETRGTTFWSDEWLWILHRRGSSISSFLDPHNSHLSLIPIAIYKLLLAVTGLRHYWPYRGVLIAADAGCALLIFVYARSRVGPYFALLASALILFFGPGWQDILWPFQIGWLIAIGSGIGALLLLDRHDRAGDVGACLMLAVSLVSAGPGLAIAIGMVVEVLLRRHRRDLWIVALPIALYVLWWIGWQQTMLNRHALLLVPRFMFDAAAGAISSLAGLSSIDVSSGAGAFLNWGPPLLVLAILGLVWRSRRLGFVPGRVYTLGAAALGFWLTTGVGRAYVTTGSFVLQGTGYESRYLYIGAILIVLIAVELARGATAGMWTKLVIGVLGLTAIISNLDPLRQAGTTLRSAAQLTKAELGTLELTRSIVNPNFVSAGVIFGIVKAGPYLAAERQLGSPAATAMQIAGYPENIRAAADAQLISIHQISVLPALPRSTTAAIAPPNVDAVASGAAAVAGGCRRFVPAGFTTAASSPALELTVPLTGLLIRTVGGAATIGLRRFATEFQSLGSLDPDRSWVLRIGPDLSSQPWHVRVGDSGQATICTLR
jgi:hypothetical protein